MNKLFIAAAVFSLTVPTIGVGQKEDATPIRVKHQITGLFSKARETDLRDAFAEVDGIKLVEIDFANAEATLEYVPAKVFPNAKPEQVIQRLDAMLKSASRHTFGIKPLRSTPKEKLKFIEIAVGGCDCKACALAAYEAVYKLDGVETATVDFREGRLTALIDPEKADPSKLEAALKQKGVTIKAR
ncbi:MAG: heavy-metal-associated domain-containing protein [Gemmataceae bacterium]|nr:heavy-metal-associated domain-containing protein [Gemmataceae bacterium]